MYATDAKKTFEASKLSSLGREFPWPTNSFGHKSPILRPTHSNNYLGLLPIAADLKKFSTGARVPAVMMLHFKAAQ